MKKADALKMDSRDSISWCKDEFLYGVNSNNNKIYFCGNSLGLQHKSVAEKINNHLSQWKDYAVESHFSWIPINLD